MERHYISGDWLQFLRAPSSGAAAPPPVAARPPAIRQNSEGPAPIFVRAPGSRRKVYHIIAEAAPENWAKSYEARFAPMLCGIAFAKATLHPLAPTGLAGLRLCGLCARASAAGEE